MKNYNNFKKELLKDREIKKAYDNLEVEFILIEEIIKKRIKKGITQKELAERIGTKQSAISRFESGSYNPSLSFLRKLADGLGIKLRISLTSNK